jgi:DNA-binding NtrC family response regulator
MAKGRILAVDDQRYFRELITGLLSQEGFEVRTAASGEEALHVLEIERFDVVVTDLVMPGMSGVEVAKRIAGERPGIRTLYISGYSDEALGSRGVFMTDTMLLQKPFDPSTLLRRVREVLA